ncbi:MAG: hypothetical protein ACLFNQ_06880 [Spirochaetaceae bacterium]
MGTTLFAGHTHPVTDELIRMVRDSNRTVALASSRHATVNQPGADTLHVPWSPRSSLSAKAVCTHVRNAFGSFDECVFTLAPGPCRAALPDLSIGDLEQYLDDTLRASMYFVREVLSLFSDQSDGVLTLILLEDAETMYAPLEQMVRSGLYGFAESLAAGYRNGIPAVYAYAGPSSSDQVEEFATFCRTERGERARGRVQRFSRRGALRGLFK